MIGYMDFCQISDFSKNAHLNCRYFPIQQISLFKLFTKVYCTGKDVYHYKLSGTKNENYIDRRSYKGGALPSSLKICPELGMEIFHYIDER